MTTEETQKLIEYSRKNYLDKLAFLDEQAKKMRPEIKELLDLIIKNNVDWEYKVDEIDGIIYRSFTSKKKNPQIIIENSSIYIGHDKIQLNQFEHQEFIKVYKKIESEKLNEKESRAFDVLKFFLKKNK